MDPLWLLLLLPTAAGSGWLVAKHGPQLWPRKARYDLPAAYFRGLNFLLNEQPDKAIEVFIKVLEVDTETVDLHLALGNLFRRRGEVERATRIHQNLIARPTLDKSQRSQALYQLGQDYFKAGLLDRAENLFLELAEIAEHREQACRHLLQIYEQEREWEKCISVARRLAKESGKSMSDVIAQYFCELAEAALTEGAYERARRYVDAAFGADSRCVRATIQSGRLYALSGDHRGAIATWRRIEDQGPVYLGEAVNLIAASYRTLGDEQGLAEFLTEVCKRHRNVKLALALADTLEAQGDTRRSEQFLVEWVHRNPSIHALHRLILLKLAHSDDALRDDLDMLDSIIGGIVERENGYECRQCGFTGKLLHWQCPGCKGWTRMVPLSSRSLVEPQVLAA